MSADAPPVSSPTRPNPNLWKWFFGIVILLTVGATAGLWLFNQWIQLTPEELAAQRANWEKNKPADYFLTYLLVENDSDAGLVYKVHVRGGEVKQAREFAVRVRERREVDPPEEEGRILDSDEAKRHTMDALYELAASIVADDRANERRVYCRARFLPENGAILEFVRRRMGSRERTQISVLAFRFGPDLES